MSENYRGYYCSYKNPFVPVIDWDWTACATDGNIIARAATLDELKAEIDALLEDE